MLKERGYVVPEKFENESYEEFKLKFQDQGNFSYMMTAMRSAEENDDEKSKGVVVFFPSE